MARQTVDTTANDADTLAMSDDPRMLFVEVSRTARPRLSGTHGAQDVGVKRRTSFLTDRRSRREISGGASSAMPSCTTTSLHRSPDRTRS